MKRTIFNRIGLQGTYKSKTTSVARPSQGVGFAAGASGATVPQRPTIPTVVAQTNAGGVQQVQPSQRVKKMHSATIGDHPRSKQDDFASTASSFVDDPSEQPQKRSKEKKARDLQGGMDLLELDFLLKVVENTQDTVANDVSMRTLCFNELIRTRRVSKIDSNSLSVYAVDRGGHYGKDIQLAAMKQLTKRTAHDAKQ
jgi:hypothetical protein